MRRVNRIFSTIFATAFLLVGVTAAQDTTGQETERPDANQPQDVRANLLRQLGLSREQIQQLRRINTERRPHMDNAQARLRQTTRALDEAIYADQIVEGDIQARMKEMQLAQAEVIKIRSLNELAIRRILTPEQLVRFRNMRQRFERARDAGQDRVSQPGQLPVVNRNSLQETLPAAKPVIKPDLP